MKYMLKEGENYPLLGQETIKGLNLDIEKIKTGTRVRFRKIFFAFFGCSIIILAILFGYLWGADIYADAPPKESENAFESEHSSEVSKDTQASVNDASTDKEDEQSTETITLPEDIYYHDPSDIPEGEMAVIPKDISMYEYGAGYINNMTGYMPDINGLLSSGVGENKYEQLTQKNNDLPKVLILHTHTTEAYLEDGAKSYIDNGSDIARSEDSQKNMIALGKIMAESFEKKGIPTLHCTVMHDSVQYMGAYDRAKATIEEYLEKYPSVELIIDLGRDSIMQSSGELIRPVTLVNSEAVAQIMCVVGSDWSGEYCPNWKNNLSIALKLREKLNAEYTNICRPCELRENTYNQELATYSLLIEVGSCGNSMEEAKRAIELVSDKLAEIIGFI